MSVTLKETCSCGAHIEVTAKSYGSAGALVAPWRAQHRDCKDYDPPDMYFLPVASVGIPQRPACTCSQLRDLSGIHERHCPHWRGA